MCGLAGVFAYAPGAVADPDDAERMSARMVCRGPDAAGGWISGNRRVVLAHRRLAIIDLSDRARQPMATPDNEVVIAYNGEIYNYVELRSSLEKKGCAFRTQSDTEVLLQLYLLRGPEMCDGLRGMFAFAIWDGRKGGLFLARDPFGIKPLYMADDGHCLRVASEVKALTRSRGVNLRPDPAGHAGFFLWGHVPEPYTLYSGIRSLPAGCSAWIDERGLRQPRRYADVSDLLRAGEADPAHRSQTEADLEVAAALTDSVQSHLVADVDVGVFLSAGLDSTTIAALATSQKPLHTVTLGFSDYRGSEHDETELAQQVASRLGARHHTIWIRQEDFRGEAGALLDRMDQPTIDGVNSYFVAKAAREAGLKVVLSGLGGDELFGGYPSFREIPRLVNAVRRLPGLGLLGSSLRKLLSAPVARLTSPKYAGLIEYGATTVDAYFLRRALFMPWELPSVLDPDFANEGWEELRQRESLAQTTAGLRSQRLSISALEASWYMRNQLLRDADWASMSHSIEVRVPLVDWVLWGKVARLAGNPKLRVDKQTMAKAATGLVPDWIRSRPKTGFTIPVRQWLIGEQGSAFGDRGLRGWARYVYSRAIGDSSNAAPQPRKPRVALLPA